MSERQRRFVQEYLVDLNATQAAIRSGYSARTAEAQASRLLRNVKVAKAIQQGMDKRANRLEITADKVLQEIAKLAFSNMLDYISVGSDGSSVVDLSGLDRDRAAAIQEVIVEEYMERSGFDEDGKPTSERVKRVRFKLTDKGANLERLGKHLKLFTEKQEVTGKDGGPIDYRPRIIVDL